LEILFRTISVWEQQHKTKRSQSAVSHYPNVKKD
jgi:hypothetical protein